MSFTLKIHQKVHEGPTVVDETTLFVPADFVRVHGYADDDSMKQWDRGDWNDYRNRSKMALKASSDSDVQLSADWLHATGRLIGASLNDEMTWYVASQAWLLGPDGGTIERVAP